MERKIYHQYTVEGVKGPFAQAVVVGDLAFIASRGPKDPLKGGVSPDDVLDQTEVVVRRLNSTLQEIGLSMANMVKHTIYVKAGEDGRAVAKKFHDEVTRYAPNHRAEPDAGSFYYVSGFTSPTTKVEVDTFAAFTDSK